MTIGDVDYYDRILALVADDPAGARMVEVCHAGAGGTAGVMHPAGDLPRILAELE